MRLKDEQRRQKSSPCAKLSDYPTIKNVFKIGSFNPIESRQLAFVVEAQTDMKNWRNTLLWLLGLGPFA